MKEYQRESYDFQVREVRLTRSCKREGQKTPLRASEGNVTQTPMGKTNHLHRHPLVKPTSFTSEWGFFIKNNNSFFSDGRMFGLNMSLDNRSYY